MKNKKGKWYKDQKKKNSLCFTNWEYLKYGTTKKQMFIRKLTKQLKKGQWTMKKALLTVWALLIITWLCLFKIIIGSGKSMLPTISNKAILLCMKQQNYKVGDIINYQIDKYSIVHRIIEIKDDGVVVQYKVKGDGNKQADGYLITKTNIKCKVLI